jgi:hypothetical protein
MAMPAAAPGPKYKAALSAAYAASLRVSEVVALKVSDIDSERLLLRIEQGKGRKDRFAMLSPGLLDLLRDWYRRAHARPRAKMDRASGSAAAGRRPSRHLARNRRGGWAAWETASLARALRGAAQGCAVLRFVSFVLAPMRLRRGLFFQTAGSAGLVASSSRMVRLRRGRCAVHCLTSARGMSAHW